MKKICASFFALLLGLVLLSPASKVSAQSISISTSLTTATMGQAYNSSISVTYAGESGLPGDAQLWSLVTGLPQGISAGFIVANSPGSSSLYTIPLTGTPTQSGTFTVRVMVDDDAYAGSTLTSQNITMTVSKTSSGNSNTFGINNQNPLPVGTVGVPYTTTIGFNYYGSLTPTAVFSSLPASIKASTVSYITPGTGYNFNYSVTLSGTPTSAGSYTANLTLTDTQVNDYYNVPILINPSSAPTPTSTVNNSQQASTTGTSGADPAGTNISSNGTVYMITSDGQIRPYTSAGAFLSYGFNSWTGVVPASSADLALPTGNFIPPRDGKIICSNKGSDKGTCYLITDSKKAAFTSAAVFTGLGFSFSNSLSGDVSFLPSAADIRSASQAHLAGTLINKDGTIYLVGDGELLGIADNATFTSWGYSLADVVKANAADSTYGLTAVMTPHMAGQLSPLGN